ncbi:ATP-binding cassette domain-containing protein [Pedobacter sp. AW1-32]|uniref:ATP-binding cassette domain-containing protein n=1 Tax=Pedobacter sp. AW1-32 TaxID=3383026 RepID=UPI003FEFDF55
MIEIDVIKRIKNDRQQFELQVKTVFQTGKMTKILGPSGVGKTTLLKILAGLIQPESGQISVNGTVWFDGAQRYHLPTQKRNIGFVFQDYALFPNMTVAEHLRFGTKDSSFLQQLLVIGELEMHENHFPNQLSGGQQQRLAIVRALSTRPKLVLMDEPFSALDHKLKSRMLPALMNLFAEQGTTVLLVTHNPNELQNAEIFDFDEA